MRNVADIWKRRVGDHQKKMLRYLKYILNDHFVIVCLFLLGALGYAYSESLKTIGGDFVYSRPIAAVIFTLSVFIGKLATLTEPADMVFLLQKETEMDEYFKKAKRYSILLPAAIIAFISAAVMPLLVATRQFSFSHWGIFFVMLLILKEMELDAQWLKTKQALKKERMVSTLVVLSLTFISVLVSLYMNPIVGAIAALVFNALWKRRTELLKKASRYQWEYLIQTEKERLKIIYSFINLFTDIPALSGTIKRRAYLDQLLKRVPLKHKHTYLYLFSRAIARGSEYSGLIFRLTVIGMIAAGFIPNAILNGFLSVLFLYLTGFQMIPLYYHYDNHLLSELYPVEQNQKLVALQRILLLLLSGQSTLLFIASLFSLPWLTALMVYAVLILFSFLFSRFYAPVRILK